MVSRRASIAVIALAGCGRVGFDAVARDGGPTATDGAGDAAAFACPSAPTTGACDPADLPFHRVQAVPSDCTGSDTCMIMMNVDTLQASIGQTAGDALVVYAYGGQHPYGSDGGTAPNMTFTVTDALGDVFAAGPYVNNAAYDDSALQIFVAPNIPGGSNTVTVTEAAPQDESFWTGLAMVEYSGLADSDVVDIGSFVAAPTGTAAATAPAIAPRAECDLVVGGMADGHVDEEADTAGGGWSLVVLDWWDPAAFVDDAATGASLGSATAIDVSFEDETDEDGWASSQLALRAAGTTAPCQPIGVEFAPAMTAANACSAPLVVDATASDGTPAITSTGIALAFTGTDASIAFYADAACAFPIASAAIGAGESSTTVYFRGTQAGTRRIEIGNADLATDTQSVTIE